MKNSLQISKSNNNKPKVHCNEFPSAFLFCKGIDMKKSLTLSPTKKPQILNVMLSDGFSQKCIGTFNEASKIFSCFRTEKRHLHVKSGGCLAINLDVLEKLNPKIIEIIYQDATGRKRELKTSKIFLERFGTRVAYASTGYEAQVFLKLDAFGMEKAIHFEQQLRSQPSLFSGVA